MAVLKVNHLTGLGRWSPRGQSHTWTLNELWDVGPSSGTSLPVTKGRAIRALLPRRRIGRPYRAARRRRGAAPQRPNRRLASKRVRDDDRLLKRVSKIRVLLV